MQRNSSLNLVRVGLREPELAWQWVKPYELADSTWVYAQKVYIKHI